ncbi:unnamed protein product (macronuclear) [Paramecium tetraurelia]|uniref:Uncharacterized protein n=1 Tax=Paramecium tetraurelia TaxID=5888 RepID=A0CB12_PARTE|nr:uncharacterized protein GSPATT00036762001 [Paramecium tetraurelia]CAK67979.1 unnamed protein product [Paramecium tetraurelia]|eukprot:XP_001435376.1 hypothetical protein (macronuclear) [Paramecium tetraurelia strain d4-2]
MQQYQKTFIVKPVDRNLIVRSTLKLPQIRQDIRIHQSIGMMNIPNRSSEHIRNSRLHTKTKTRDTIKAVVKERPHFKQLPTDRTMPTLPSLNSPRSEDEGDSTHKSLFSLRRTVIDTLSLRQSRRTSVEKERFKEEKKDEKREEKNEEERADAKLSGRHYVKSEEQQTVHQQLSKSHGELNENHMNLDEVLEEPVEEIRPKKESQSIRPKNESVSSQFTQITDEIHSVWDNVDLYLRGVQFDEFEQQAQLQSFLQLYKMRSGGFPNLSNEEVIRRAAEYAKGNRQVFKKYFPTKQVVFENEEDYTQSYDVNSDANFQKFQKYIQKYNQQ